MKIYLISGATGFLGKTFVDSLIEKREKVVVLVRDKYKVDSSWKNIVTIVEKDLADIGSLSREEIGCTKGDEIITVHFAWEGTSGDKRSRDITQLNNVRLSCELMRRVRQIGGKRFINAGSIMEYEAIKTVATDGERPHKNTVYSVAKLAANFMMKTIAADIDIDYVNVIISNIYGPGETSHRFLNNVVRALINNIDLDLTEGNQLYDFIYVDDAMNMIYAVAENGKAFESYYIGNEKQRPLRDYVEETYSIIGGESKLNFGAVPFIGQALTYTEFDVTKVARELGIIPQVSFEEGIKLTKEWIINSGKTDYN